MKTSDKYLKLVQWSEEDGCYVGTCPGLMHGGVHGPDEAAVYAELCTVVDEWLRIYEEDGAPLPPATAGRSYSGKFLLRPGKELHEHLAIQALCVNESLNTYCVDRLRESVPAAPPAKAKATRRRRSPSAK